MRYKTDIDKEYLGFIVEAFKNNVISQLDENFDKRSSITEQGGRPYMYSPKEMGMRMLDYFNDCIEYEKPFMVKGICLYVGISKRGLLRLEKSSNDKFVPLIKKGKELVEFYLEMQGNIKPNPAFSIFVLKNMGWRDKTIDNNLGRDAPAIDLEELRGRIDKISE
jgi:hypothetical protein